MILHMVLGLLLLAVPAGVLYYYDKRMLRYFMVAVVRMFVQLLVLCLMVMVLIRYHSVWLSLLWVFLLTLLSAFVAWSRSKVPTLFYNSIFLGILIGSLLTGGYLLGVVFPVKEWLEPRWFVPVIALLMGHTTTSVIRGLSAYYSSLHADEQHYEFMRGNGHSHLQAVTPFVRRSLQAMLSPSVNNLYRMGLYTMPLLLCGILLGGMTPINAFVLTLMLTIGCLAASVIALGITLWLADVVLFDRFGKLIHPSDKENKEKKQ